METRTNTAIKNSVTSLICHMIGVIVSFASRTIFTYLLGSEYLGISSLFTNILTLLSFAELGFGSAIVYRLYAPLANNDYNTVRLYIQLYKKVYTIVSILILLLGLIIIPFLGYLVEAPAVTEDVRLLYCLYLLQTAVSYICVYKKSFLIADQKAYIVSLVSQIVTIVMHLTQIIILLVTHNFVLYCLLLSIFSFGENIVCVFIVDKKYPYIKEKTVGKLSSSDITGVKKDIKGLMLTKVASTILTGTDNLFISLYIGISAVGILSNYTLIFTTMNGMMNKVFSSITAVVGNLAVKKDPAQAESVLNKMYFFNASVYCLICTVMLVLIKEFITSVWLTAEYSLPDIVIIVAIAELLLRSLHFPLHTTQMALGLFSQYKFMSIVAAFTNLFLDFILVKPFGIAGLIIATILSRMIIYITDIYVVYRFGFGKSSVSYVVMVAKWLLYIIVCAVVSGFAVTYVNVSGILGFILRLFIVVAIYSLLYFIIYHKNPNLLYYRNLIKTTLKRRKVR